MAISWHINTDESIGYDQFIAHLDSLGSAPLTHRLDETALMLRRLYNNRRFLVEVLHSQMQDMKRFEEGNPYTPQVFILHKAKHYMVRAAIWVPPKGGKGEEIFFYEDAHDHNFDLLTLGYLGSGYRTMLFEYDYESTSGYAGETVPVRYLEDTRLPEKKVMLFRKSRDIHVQLPPEEFSVSINVLSSGDVPHQQYSFDMALEPDTRTATLVDGLVGYLPNTFSRFGHALGVEGVPDRLRSMLRRPIDGSLRLSVAQALVDLEGEHVWQELRDDPSQLVRQAARHHDSMQPG